MSERKIAFVQARMGSSRMPGKMMMDLMGKPLLARTIDRIRRSRLVDDVVVLTTTSPIDDLIVAFGEDSQVSVFRGQEADVVGRYFDAAKHFENIMERVQGVVEVVCAGATNRARVTNDLVSYPPIL